jgi:hypothetical protein
LTTGIYGIFSYKNVGEYYCLAKQEMCMKPYVVEFSIIKVENSPWRILGGGVEMFDKMEHARAKQKSTSSATLAAMCTKI